MSFQDEFAQKAKEYLKPDPDEAILKREYTKIMQYFTELNKKIGEVKDESYVLRSRYIECFIKINDVYLNFKVNKSNNTVEVLRDTGAGLTKIDTWSIKNESLFSEKHGIKVENEMIDDYLKETFQNILEF